MKAERTMQDELRRIRALRRNPVVEGEEDARLLGAQATLEWIIEGGPPPVYCCITGVKAGPYDRAPVSR